MAGRSLKPVNSAAEDAANEETATEVPTVSEFPSGKDAPMRRLKCRRRPVSAPEWLLMPEKVGRPTPGACLDYAAAAIDRAAYGERACRRLFRERDAPARCAGAAMSWLPANTDTEERSGKVKLPPLPAAMV